MNVWEIFSDHLGGVGYDEKDLSTLLKFIDALEPPVELPRVLGNFLQIIPCLQRLIKQYSGFDLAFPFSEWSDICLELKSAPAMQELLVATNKKGKMPLRGNYDTNPVYVAIWHRPGSPSNQQTYFQLLAHCLIAVAILRGRTDKQKLDKVSKQELDNFNINAALLAVRNLSVAENLNILEALPDLNVPPEELLRYLEKTNEALAPLKVLLKYLLQLRKPPHRQEHANPLPSQPGRKLIPQTDLPALISRLFSNLDSEQEEGATTFDLFQLPVVGETKAQEIEHVGCSPTEGCSGIEIVVPQMCKANCKQIRSPDQKGLQKRRIKTQLSMLNQRLTSRWEVLSLYEVSAYLTAIADLIEKKERSVYLPNDATHGEMSALLATLFWFGQRLDKVNKLRVYHLAPGNKDTEPGFVSMTGQYRYWWTKPAIPIRKNLPDDVQQEQAHPTVTNFALSTGTRCEQIINSYLKSIRRGRPTLLFPKKQSVYAKMISDFFSSVNSRHATRLTANRISDYLFDVLARQDGADLTTAMFIIGREHFLGRNPSYYTSISVTQLQALYTKLCKEIGGRHFREKPRDNQGRVDSDLADPWPVNDQTSHVGSPFRPTNCTVAILVTELKKSLKNSVQSDSSVLKIMRVHNNMTRYTAFLIAFSTGFRAIRDPFLSAAEIDWQSGFAVLSDKDNEDSYNSRMIWLPPVCLQQLQFFREHQQNALYRFNILIPGIFSNPDRPRRDAPGRYMFFAGFDSVNAGYAATTLGPKLLGKNLRSVYALPFNSSRHYLRSCLLERKCPVEVINAFMGHFERGEEPWGVYSGFSPLAYRDALMDKLVPLLNEDGWEALCGLKAQL